MPLDFAKDFELKELVVESITGQEWDISFLLAELNVHEDLFNNTVYANVVIDDADNRIAKIPLTGHEWIRIRFKTPDRSEIKLHLRTYKITARELEKERRQLFILHCVSAEEFTNNQVRVSKAYKGKLISDIADDVQTNFLGSTFSTLETTKNSFHLIPANWTPFRTLNFLAARATSEVYQGANYLYFQNANGHNFVSIEHLCGQQPRTEYLLQPANIRDQEVETGHKPRTIETDQQNIQTFRFVNTFDTLENLQNGMYGNTLLWHDIIKKDFDEIVFDYKESFGKFKHVDKGMLYPTQSDLGSAFGAYKFWSTGMPQQETHAKYWIQQRLSQMQQIQNTRLHCTVPGDSDRRVGDIVQVWLPSPEPLVENKLVMDPHYQGKYLVTSIRHTIVKSNYYTVLELVKDSVFTPYP